MADTPGVMHAKRIKARLWKPHDAERSRAPAAGAVVVRSAGDLQTERHGDGLVPHDVGCRVIRMKHFEGVKTCPGEVGDGIVTSILPWVRERRDAPCCVDATHDRGRRVAMARGLRHVYTGNIHDEASQATRCHACGAVLIGRDWHRITAWGLTDDGRCRQCDAACPGVFDGPPGRWGQRRRPLALGSADWPA